MGGCPSFPYFMEIIIQARSKSLSEPHGKRNVEEWSWKYGGRLEMVGIGERLRQTDLRIPWNR